MIKMSHLDKVIVLDLDETLIHTLTDNDFNAGNKGYELLRLHPDLRGRLYKLNIQGSTMWSIKRPYVDVFLRYVLDNFGKVIVWSAGIDEYVHEVVEWLFGTIFISPDAIYGRSFCEIESKKYTKPIRKLVLQPDLSGYVRLENTLFIDDNVISTSPNPSNAVTIPRYQPNPINVSELLAYTDRSLLQLIDWLESDAIPKYESGTSMDIRVLQKSIFRNESQNTTPIIKI